MKILPVSTIKQNNKNFGHKVKSAEPVNPQKDAEFKAFMKELDQWTKDALEIIDTRFEEHTIDKEVCIDELFMRRSAKISQMRSKLYGEAQEARSLLRRLFKF